MLSGCGSEEAERKRLELQEAVDNLQFEAKPGRMLPITISIGASIFPHDGDSYETLLATADSRMYRDKTRRKRHASGVSAPPDDEPRSAASGGLSSRPHLLLLAALLAAALPLCPLAAGAGLRDAAK